MRQILLIIIILLFSFPANAQMRTEDLPDYSELSVTELERLNASGDAHAAYALGYFLLFGDAEGASIAPRPDADFSRAILLLEKAHSAGHPWAFTVLRLYYAGEMGHDAQPEEERRVVREAFARIDEPIAEFYFGTYFFNDPDKQTAKAAFGALEAVKTDDVFSADAWPLLVETLYQGSPGIDADRPRARQEAQACARALPSDPFCPYILGRDFSQGWGGPKDAVKSADYFLQSARNGDARAQWMTAMNHLSGGSLPLDEELAFEWVEKSAAQDYENGLISLGVMYATGQGTEQDYEKSFAAYEKAVFMGSPHAMRAIGGMYFAGEGRKADPDTAAAALILAADTGEENAIKLLDMFFDVSTPEDVETLRLKVQSEIDALKLKYRWKP